MALSVHKWRQLVDPYFAFLEMYGFRLVDGLSESGPWRTRISYVSEDRGISVDYNVEFNRVEVSLLRLTEGQLEPQVWVTDAPISEILLDNVLQARAPERTGTNQRLAGLGQEQLKEQLRIHSTAFQEFVADFLTGSFAAMDDGERLIRERLHQHPQEMTVWLSEHASADDERKALEEAKATTPADVAVIARRYGRPAR